MWLYSREGDAIETLTHLESGAQVVRSGEGAGAELWWRGNVIDAPLERDEMKLAGSDGETKFQQIVDALQAKGELAGYTGPVEYKVPGE